MKLPKCPNCGAVLEPTGYVVGTDYSKAKEKLQEAAEQNYSTLPWKQSLKRPALSTILVRSELLREPLINELYNRLRTNPNFSFKIDHMTFKLSTTPEGTEFLQRWAPLAK